MLRGRDPICKKLRQGGVTPPASPAGGSVVTVAETAPVVSDDSVVSNVEVVRPCRVGNLLQYQGDLYKVTEIMSERVAWQESRRFMETINSTKSILLRQQPCLMCTALEAMKVTSISID